MFRSWALFEFDEAVTNGKKAGKDGASQSISNMHDSTAVIAKLAALRASVERYYENEDAVLHASYSFLILHSWRPKLPG